MTQQDKPQEHSDALAKANTKIQIWTSYVFLPIPPAVALTLNPETSWVPLLLVGLALCGLTVLAKVVEPGLRALILAFALISHSVLFTASFAGHPWQLDSHMLFFAMLAIVSISRSPAALLFATALVAVHHLSLSVLMPSIVYPSGTVVENLQRTVFHAIIVVLETGVLLVSMRQGLAADAAAKSERETARMLAESARSAEEQSNAARDEAEDVARIVSDHLSQLASGRLDCHIAQPLPGNHQQLRESFNSTVDRLQSVLTEVQTVTDSLSSNANAVAGSSGTLRERTENQATSLDASATALRDLTEAVTSAAHSADEVTTTVEQAKDRANESGDVVGQAVAAMKAIEDSSSQIGKTISVINDIAFQTNLLALNAGVEAARAGEAGRGFAVVASEVRALAMRSAEAAKEIKTLISQSTNQVSTGVDLVGKAGDALGEIVESVNNISMTVATISSGTAGQAKKIDDINARLRDLSQVTQSNHGIVDRVASAGDTLLTDADALVGLMTQFQTGVEKDQPHRSAA